MNFEKPIGWSEAEAALKRRGITPSAMGSTEWSGVEAAIRAEYIYLLFHGVPMAAVTAMVRPKLALSIEDMDEAQTLASAIWGSPWTNGYHAPEGPATNGFILVSAGGTNTTWLDPQELTNVLTSFPWANLVGAPDTNLWALKTDLTNLVTAEVGALGTNATNYAAARVAPLQTGSLVLSNAAGVPGGPLTNAAAFQPASSTLTNLANGDGSGVTNVNAATVGGYGTNGLVIYGRRYYAITDFWPQSAIVQMGSAAWGTPAFPMVSNSSTSLYIPLRNQDFVGSGTNVILKARIFTTNNAVIGPLRIRTYSTSTSDLQAGSDGGGPKAFSSAWPNDTCTTAPAGTNFWWLTLTGSVNVSANASNFTSSVGITPNGTKTNFWVTDAEVDFK